VCNCGGRSSIRKVEKRPQFPGKRDKSPVALGKKKNDIAVLRKQERGGGGGRLKGKPVIQCRAPLGKRDGV